MEQLYIGIDMGGTKCAVVAGHADGKILRRIAFPSGKDAHPDEFLPRFYEAIDALLREVSLAGRRLAFVADETWRRVEATLVRRPRSRAGRGNGGLGWSGPAIPYTATTISAPAPLTP